MIKYFCDKCDKEIDGDEATSIDIDANRFIEREHRQYLLCKTCMDGLNAYLTGKPVQMLDGRMKYQCSGCEARFDSEIVYLIGGFDAWLFCPCCGERIKQ